MKFFKLTNICRVVIAAVILFMSPVSVYSAVNSAPDTVGYSMIKQSGDLALYLNKDDLTFMVVDSNNDYHWSSSVMDWQYDIDYLNDQWQNNIKTMFTMRYTNLTKADGIQLSTDSVSGNPQTNLNLTANGFSIDYFFESLQIGLTVVLELNDSGFTITIPASSIREGDDFGIVSLEMLSFFGSVMDWEDGYLFYPDGSGAILEFDDPIHYNAPNHVFSIYGTDDTDWITGSNEMNIAFDIYMPVFGVKHNDNAFLGIITKGDFESNIQLSPANEVIELNRIYPEFIYRRPYIDPRTTRRPKTKYKKTVEYNDFEIKYVLLNDNDADYSGMANAYRGYLLNEKDITPKIGQDDQIPVSVDLFMGINEQRLLFNHFVSMTTFKQAETILSEFLNQGVTAIQTTLRGWTKNGQWTEPVAFPPNSKLGGESGLKALADYTSRNNIKLFLEGSMVYAYSSEGGFSKRNDVAYQANTLTLGSMYGDNGFFVLNPTAIRKRFFDIFMPKATKFNISGISFTQFGSYIYQDYNTKFPSSKYGTSAVWNELTGQSVSRFGSAAVDGGNIYMLETVDRLNYITDRDSEYFLTTKPIPFYQMVVHGIVPYSGGEGNLAYDYAKQKLKWVEYGYIPSFELTYESPNALKYTYYNGLFSSEYTDWIDTVTNVYNEFNMNLAVVYGQFMIKHEELEKDVYKTVYEDGTAVYVNYNSSPSVVEGVTVGPMDYVVTGKGGGL